jgi:diguanylate cyclase (GGDEF)-like protein/PAS domain S-box-containing protein
MVTRLQIQTRRLLIVAAAIELFTGISIHTFPGEFSASVYSRVTPWFPLLSAGLLICGLLFLPQFRYNTVPWVGRMLSALAAIPLVGLAYSILTVGGVTGGIAYIGLAMALLVVPWCKEAESPLEAKRQPDLLDLTLGMIEAVVGFLMIGQPGLFASSAFAPIHSALPYLGLISLVGAAGLLASFARLRPTVRFPWLFRAPGSLMPLVLTIAFVRTGTWTGLMWAIWGAVSLISPEVIAIAARRLTGTGSAETAVEPADRTIAATAHHLATLNWLLVFGVVALTIFDGQTVISSPLRAHLFALLLSSCNVLVYCCLPHGESARRRVHWYLACLTVSIGLLISDPAPASQAFLPLLLGVPIFEGRVGGRTGGAISSAAVLVTVTAARLMRGVQSGDGLHLAWAGLIVTLSVLALGGYVGTLVATDHNKLIRSLDDARKQLNRQVRQLALIDEIGAAIRKSLYLSAILETTATALGTCLQADRCTIHLPGSGGAQGLSYEYVVPAAPGLSTPLQSGVAGPLLTVTARFESDVVATIALHSSADTRSWTTDEVEFVEAIASQVAVAIGHAHHHKALEDGHEALLRAHETLQTQSEELAAQQEELTAQHEELISQRDQLESALASARSAQEARDRMAATVEATPDLVVIYGQKEGWQYINPAGQQLLGLSEGLDLAKYGPHSFYSKRAQAAEFPQIREAVLRGGVWQGETTLCRVDGSEVPVFQIVLAHVDSDGRLLFVSSIIRDISDAKRAEEAMRESERRFRTAFRDAPIGMALVRTDGTILQGNQALCRMLGYGESELQALTSEQITYGEDRPVKARALNQIADGQMDSFQLENRYLHKDGHVVWGQMGVSAVRDSSGEALHLIAHIEDITQRKWAEEQLKHLADYDSLTNLYNRRRFQEELTRHLSQAQETGRGGALLFLDFDQFKYVNDSLGHPAGDELLQGLANLLKGALRDDDLIARLGGDEFAILLPGAVQEPAERKAQELLRLVGDNVQVLGDHPVGLTVSIGIALYPEHGTTASQLLAQADLAMYQVKESGRNHYRTYQPQEEYLAQVGSRLNWERRIRMALDQDRFVLHFQPIYDLHSGQVIQHEALLRMVETDGSLIYPGAFLGVAESFGLIHRIDRWVLHQTIRTMADARRQGRELCLAVNLSGKAFSDPDLLAQIRTDLNASGVHPGQLVLEITETATIRDLTRARQFIMTLKEMGCRFSLDDFGVGFASFNYLKHLPVDFVKIDGSFIQQVATNPEDERLVRAIVAAAHALGKQTIAEHVSDQESIRLLRTMGVSGAQGYYLKRPGDGLAFDMPAPFTATP